MCCKIVFKRLRKRILNPLQHSLRLIYTQIIVQTKFRATEIENVVLALHNFLILSRKRRPEKKLFKKLSIDRPVKIFSLPNCKYHRLHIDH